MVCSDVDVCSVVVPSVVVGSAAPVSRDLLSPGLAVLGPEDLDRGQHPEEEHERDDDERRQPAARIVRAVARKQERGRKREGDEDARRDGEPDLVSR